MDTKYKGHGFIKLWIATTMFMLCCFATGTLAQDTVIADTATVTETITELQHSRPNLRQKPRILSATWL